MKSLRLTAILAIAGAFLVACGGNEAAQTTETETETAAEEVTVASVEHQIDLANSMVGWEGSILGLYSHNGSVQLTEGKLVTEGENIVGGNFTIDMSSITPLDENYNPEEGHGKAELVGHLSSDDFFNVETYPTASFEITGAGEDAGTLVGNLTVRDKTNQETIEDVSIDMENGTATGTLTFDRTKYDVNFSHPAEDKVLSDDIDLEINLKIQG